MMLGRARMGRNGKGTGHGRRGLKAAVKTARAAPLVDSEIIFKIGQHLRRAHKIPADRIKTEHAVRIYKDGYVVLKPNRRGRAPRSKGLVHAPDIIVLDDDDRIRFVIEQDGRIHESNRVAKKDVERNRHYAAAGIPCIVLSTRAIRSEGVPAAEYLDREMGRVLVGAGPGISHVETPAAAGGAATAAAPG